MRVDNVIYLDHQATTPVDRRVFKVMEPYFCEQFGNPHSTEHDMGWNAYLAVEKAQNHIAELVGCDANEVIFTSGATESNNLALLGLAHKSMDGDRKRILLSTIEHKSILELDAVLRHQYGFAVDLIPVDGNGFVDMEFLEHRMDNDVLLVSVMAVNNEIGTIQDMQKIAEFTHQHGAILHSDFAQAPCAISLPAVSESIDLISLSAHKMYGPKGIGALIANRSIINELEPMIYGGEQQDGIRSGTLPVPLCVGLGEAARILSEPEAFNEREQIKSLRKKLLHGLLGLDFSIELNGPKLDQRHPGNLNLSFFDFSAIDLLSQLRPKLAASTGSACTSGWTETSHVLRAIKLPDSAADVSIRLSVGRFTTVQDVDDAIEIIDQALQTLVHSGLGGMNTALG